MDAGNAAKEQLEELEKAGEEAPEETRTELNRLVPRRGDTKGPAEANLRLVVSIAKRYVGRGCSSWTRRATWSSTQAVEKFDYTQGATSSPPMPPGGILSGHHPGHDHRLSDSPSIGALITRSAPRGRQLLRSWATAPHTRGVAADMPAERSGRI